MLEAQAHLRLKQLLKQGGGSSWPHHLTLTRLVARSLRRGDHSLFPVSATVDRPWLAPTGVDGKPSGAAGGK